MVCFSEKTFIVFRKSFKQLGFDFKAPQNSKRRALFAFDVAAAVPSGATIDSVERFSSNDYRGVKVTALESMMVRKNADTYVAGEIHVLKDLLLKDGTPLTTLNGYGFTAAALDDSGVHDEPIVTEIAKAGPYYVAEDDHQDYYRQNRSAGYCRAIIAPKLGKLELEQ